MRVRPGFLKSVGSLLRLLVRTPLGDAVFIPGLFTFAPGDQKNIPIVRYGNIAMLPDEPIQVDAGFAEVDLVEARSIGGMSGSPVIARRTVGIQGERKGGSEIIVDAATGFYLLGLVARALGY